MACCPRSECVVEECFVVFSVLLDQFFLLAAAGNCSSRFWNLRRCSQAGKQRVDLDAGGFIQQMHCHWPAIEALCWGPVCKDHFALIHQKM